MIIIQIFSKISHAKREMLKNEKCTWRSWDCICSSLCLKNHLMNVSLKRKTNTILHHHTAYDYRKGSTSRWYTTARCWYTTSKPFFQRMFTNPGRLLTNVAVYDRPNWTHHFQVARHFGRRHSTIGGLYRCCSIPTALVLSAAVIRRVMMEMLSVFRFSEAFSKWVVR